MRWSSSSGHSASQLSHAHYATEVTSIETPVAAAGYGTAGVENSATLKYIFIAAACALLFPGSHLHLGHRDPGSPRRAASSSFAAMRLVERDPTAGLSVIVPPGEASLAAVGGVAVGFGLFFLLRPALTTADFTGRALLPRRSVTGAGGHPARRHRHPRRGSGGGTCRAAAGADRSARREPARYTARPPGLAGHPAAGGHRRAQLLRRRRASRHHRRPGNGVLPRIPPAHDGTDNRGPVADDGGRAGHGQAGQQPGHAHRRAAGSPDNPRAAFRAISGLILALFVTGTAVGVITTLVDDHGGGGLERGQHPCPRNPSSTRPPTPRPRARRPRPPIPSRNPYWQSFARYEASRP